MLHLKSINFCLFSFFTKSSATGTDSLSVQKRYRALSIIYLNILTISMFISWRLFAWLFLPSTEDPFLIIGSPLVFLSLFFLRQGDHEKSVGIFLGCLHLIIFMWGSICGISIGALFATNLMPSISVFITSSSWLHTMNIVLCFVQYVIQVLNVRAVFNVVMTPEQEVQITTMQVAALITLSTHWARNYLRKYVETEIWQHAEFNYEKAENITKELVEALAAKDTFVSSLSHEIRNPLNSLNGSINYLLGVLKESSHVEILKNAKLSGEILLNLVNNVLDAAKLKSDKMELANFEVDPVETIKKALIINTEALKRNKLSVQAFIYKAIPPRVWIDPGRFLQIMMNLMSNAIKFTKSNKGIKIYMEWYKAETEVATLREPIEKNPFNMGFGQHINELNNFTTAVTQDTSKEESPELHCSEESPIEFGFSESRNHQDNLRYLQGMTPKSMKHLSLSHIKPIESLNPWIIMRQTLPFKLESLRSDPIPEIDAPTKTSPPKGGFLKVQVSDDGCGIPSNVLPKLFTMFTQSHSTIANKYGGTGLGLWISQQLCQKMGGDITVYSKEGQGTSFVFYIPVNVDSEAEKTLNRASTSRKINVLVVDDYAFNRDLHKLILEREGVQVTLASNGVEAVKEYTKQEDGYFDFIMMDVQMPEMDGFTAAKKIRDFEECYKRKHVMIYFVSGEYYDEREVLVELKVRGGVPETSQIKSMRKPIDVELVKKIVEKCGDQRQNYASTVYRFNSVHNLSKLSE